MSTWDRGRRGLLALLAAGAATTSVPALAQANLPPGAVVQPLGSDRAASLRMHLVELGANPNSVSALTGAGFAALELGDPQAALQFFGRAEALSPRNPRVLAGMGRAFVRTEQVRQALNCFEQAAAAGANPYDFMADRGLAYDLSGDPRRAQQDYTAALRMREDPEVRRRLSLSLAISGQRDAALQVIDGQLRSNDRAAWRTRAFVHAVTGDYPGAEAAARSSLAPLQASAMLPFLGRLAALSPAQKAAAVHFGHFPSDGQPRPVYAGVDTSAYPGALAVAGVRPTQQAGSTLNLRTAATDQSVARRLPATDRLLSGGSVTGARRRTTAPPVEPLRLLTRRSETAPAAQATRVPVQATPSVPTNPVAPAAPTAVPAAPVQIAQAAPAPTVPAPTPPAVIVSSAAPTTSEQTPVSTTIAAPPAVSAPVTPVVETDRPVAVQPIQAVQEPAVATVPLAASTASDTGPGLTEVAPVQSAAATAPSPAAASSAAPITDFSAIASLVSTLPVEEPVPSIVRPAAPAAASPPAATTPARPRSTAMPFGPPTPPRAASTQPRPAAPIRVAEARVPTSRTGSETRTPTSRTTTAPAPAERRTRAARPAHPARHWVQLAMGPNRDMLPRAFASAREKAASVLGSRQVHIGVTGANSRLLVGPFDDEDAARAFLNQLARADVSATLWTSAEGQEIERLNSTRR